MRRQWRIVGLVIVLAIVGLFTAAPEDAFAVGPSGTYGSGISCINLTETNGAIQIQFYNQSGTLVATVSKPEAFEPNKPWLLFTPSLSQLGSAFTGSGVVSSDVNSACSVNTQTVGGTQRVGTSEGVGAQDIGPKLFATQILNALSAFNSYVAIQNTAGTAVQVKATYFDANGNKVKELAPVSVPGYASHIFYQDQPGDLPANFIGSATFEAVDGTTPLAGTVALYNSSTAQLLSVNTFKAGAAKAFLPRLSKNLSGVGYTSGWACQNLGPGEADMVMDVTFGEQGANNQVVNTVTAKLTKNDVKEGQSWLGYMAPTGAAALDAIAKGFGSAVVTSTGGQIACTVNEDNRTQGSNLNGQGSTYAGVPDGEQSATMSFPQIVALGVNSFRGGFQIANTTGTATTCKFTFSNGDVVSNRPLGAAGSDSVFAETILTNNKTNFNGSVKVECGQPIVGIYNLSVIGPNASGDPFATNNGINQQ